LGTKYGKAYADFAFDYLEDKLVEAAKTRATDAGYLS